MAERERERGAHANEDAAIISHPFPPTSSLCTRSLTVGSSHSRSNQRQCKWPVDSRFCPFRFELSAGRLRRSRQKVQLMRGAIDTDGRTQEEREEEKRGPAMGSRRAAISARCSGPVHPSLLRCVGRAVRRDRKRRARPQSCTHITRRQSQAWSGFSWRSTQLLNAHLNGLQPQPTRASHAQRAPPRRIALLLLIRTRSHSASALILAAMPASCDRLAWVAIAVLALMGGPQVHSAAGRSTQPSSGSPRQG